MKDKTVKRQKMAILLLYLVANIVLHGVCPAADMVSHEFLGALTDGVDRPTQVAVDEFENVYVTETSRNIVSIFRRDGAKIHTISGLDKPVSIFVDPDGKVYIGNLGRGSVEVYDKTYSYLFSLGAGVDGQGNGEFGHPSDIEVDSGGNIYVADKVHSIIGVYTKSGAFHSLLGEPGSGDGQLNSPVSIALGQTANELVVLDLQERNDQFTHGLMSGARIQIFQMDGHFLRGYTKFGYDREHGELVVPVHLAVDEQSRILVSDARLQKVMVYDKNGLFLGMIDSSADPLRIPLGIALSHSNKLYVASIGGGRVAMFGLNSQVEFEVAPSVLHFTIYQNEGPGAAKPLEILNTGSGAFSWEASADSAWITLSSTEGILEQGGRSTLEVGIEPASLGSGIHSGTVSLVADGHVTRSVTVNLTVLPSSGLIVSPTELNFSTIEGITPSPQSVIINHGGEESISWSSASSSGWLIMEEESGATLAETKVYLDISHLPPGDYSDTIIVTNNDDSGEQRSVAVNLSLDENSGGTGSEWFSGSTVSKKWLKQFIVDGVSLNGVWGSSDDNVFAVGDNGTILHFDGSSWKGMASGVVTDLHSIWGSSSDEVYTVGEAGVVLSLRDGNWSMISAPSGSYRGVWASSPVDILVAGFNGKITRLVSSTHDCGAALLDIWGSDPVDIFAVGESGAILRFFEGSWITMDSPTSLWLKGIWGHSANHVYSVGEIGTIVFFDGTQWRTMKTEYDLTLNSVWGNGKHEVYAVGESGIMLHLKDGAWQPVDTRTGNTLNDVWVSETSEVFAVGDGGLLVRGTPAFPWSLFIRTLTVIHGANEADNEREP